MIKGIVRYWDLGRSNASGKFKVEVDEPNQEDKFNNALFKEFSKHLLSDDVSFDNGKIHAGFHTVGQFEFVAVKE